jgi:hypothetical protein
MTSLHYACYESHCVVALMEKGLMWTSITMEKRHYIMLKRGTPLVLSLPSNEDLPAWPSPRWGAGLYAVRCSRLHLSLRSQISRYTLSLLVILFYLVFLLPASSVPLSFALGITGTHSVPSAANLISSSTTYRNAALYFCGVFWCSDLLICCFYWCICVFPISIISISVSLSPILSLCCLSIFYLHLHFHLHIFISPISLSLPIFQSPFSLSLSFFYVFYL